MKIYPIGQNLIQKFKRPQSSNQTFGNNEHSFASEQDFKPRKRFAELMGLSTGVIGLGLGLLWIAGRLVKRNGSK